MSIEDTNTIDLVAQDRSGAVVMIMVEGREWNGSNERLYELQEKINTYATFALEGELNEKYPYFSGKPVRLELRAASVPDRATADFLAQVRVMLAEQGLDFRIVQLSENQF
jgi:hypothetical protein